MRYCETQRAGFCGGREVLLQRGVGGVTFYLRGRFGAATNKNLHRFSAACMVTAGIAQWKHRRRGHSLFYIVQWLRPQRLQKCMLGTFLLISTEVHTGKTQVSRGRGAAMLAHYLFILIIIIFYPLGGGTTQLLPFSSRPPHSAGAGQLGRMRSGFWVSHVTSVLPARSKPDLTEIWRLS